MNFARPVILSFSLLAFAGMTAHAQNTAGSASAAGGTAQAEQSPQPATQPQQSERAQSEQAPGEMGLNRLIGQKVRDSQGKDLGEIKDVVIDMQSGRVHAAVLEFGGVLGVGAKQYAFPLSELKSGDKDALTVDVDKQKLENAEGFAKGQWPAMDSEYWGRVRGEGEASAGQGQASAGASASQGEKLNLVRASKLLDEEVSDNRGQKVGKLKDVIVSLDDGSLKALSIDVDDAGQVSVQPDAATLGTENKLVLDKSSQEVKEQARQSNEQAQPKAPPPARESSSGATGK